MRVRQTPTAVVALGQTRPVDTGQTDLVDFGRQLREHGGIAHVRALLLGTEEGWVVYHVWALVGAEPPDWLETTWQYEQLSLVSCRLPAGDLSALFSGDTGAAITLGETTAHVRAGLGPANWTRRPSYAIHDRMPLPIPVTEYQISAADPNRHLPHHMLVGEGCPSFPEPNSAWRAFAEGDYSLTGASQPPHELALIRIAETGGWIGTVHVTATHLSAEVRGTAVAGAELELFGVADRSQQQLDGPATVSFALSSGLPASAWLWLKRRTQWLDYRPIDAGSGWTGDLSRAGVEIEQPVDPQANVEALIASGEGPQLEFKERLPAGPGERKLLKSVPAFANGTGGTILFGINRDETTVTGLAGEDVNGLRDRLVNLVRAAVVPMPQVTVTPYTIDGKLILALDVEPGQSPPYGLISSPDTRDKPDFYVRRGASTYPAQPGELREATLANQPTEQALNLASPFGHW